MHEVLLTEVYRLSSAAHEAAAITWLRHGRRVECPLQRLVGRHRNLCSKSENGYTESWQQGCGSNENTNRLLRQYFPKGANLSVHSQAKLNAVTRQLNELPRQTLELETPAERFNACVASIG